MDTSCLHHQCLVIGDGSLDNCPNFRRHKLLKRIPELLWLEFSEFVQCDDLKTNREPYCVSVTFQIAEKAIEAAVLKY